MLQGLKSSYSHRAGWKFNPKFLVPEEEISRKILSTKIKHISYRTTYSFNLVSLTIKTWPKCYSKFNVCFLGWGSTVALLFCRLLEESQQQLRVSNAPTAKEPEIPGQAEGQLQPSSSTWKNSPVLEELGYVLDDGRPASHLVWTEPANWQLSI